MNTYLFPKTTKNVLKAERTCLIYLHIYFKYHGVKCNDYVTCISMTCLSQHLKLLLF